MRHRLPTIGGRGLTIRRSRFRVYIDARTWALLYGERFSEVEAVE